MSLGDTSSGVSSPPAFPGTLNDSSLSPLSGVLHTLNFPPPALAQPSHPQSYNSEFPVGDGVSVLESRSDVNATSHTGLNPNPRPYAAPSASESSEDTAVESRMDILKDAILEFVHADLPKPVTLKLSVQELQELELMGNSGLLDGWGTLHIDYDEEYLNIKLPNWLHSVFRGIFFSPKRYNTTLSELLELAGLRERLQDVDAVVELPDRTWTPTAVFEIGLSDAISKSNFDAARMMIGTYGLVRFVLNVNIQKGSKVGQLDWVTADLWVVEGFEQPNDDYDGCEISLKETITYYDVDTGCYEVASKDFPPVTKPMCWKYFYCFQSVEGDHVHYIVRPFQQYLVHHDEQSSTQPPKSLTEFTPGPIQIPRYLLVSSFHHMYSHESRFDIDLTIEFSELLKHIQDGMKRDKANKRWANIKTPYSKELSRMNQANKAMNAEYIARRNREQEGEEGTTTLMD